jgi:hypothetical protein
MYSTIWFKPSCKMMDVRPSPAVVPNPAASAKCSCCGHCSGSSRSRTYRSRKRIPGVFSLILSSQPLPHASTLAAHHCLHSPPPSPPTVEAMVAAPLAVSSTPTLPPPPAATSVDLRESVITDRLPLEARAQWRAEQGSGEPGRRYG